MGLVRDALVIEEGAGVGVQVPDDAAVCVHRVFGNGYAVAVASRMVNRVREDDGAAVVGGFGIVDRLLIRTEPYPDYGRAVGGVHQYRLIKRDGDLDYVSDNVRLVVGSLADDCDGLHPGRGQHDDGDGVGHRGGPLLGRCKDDFVGPMMECHLVAVGNVVGVFGHDGVGHAVFGRDRHRGDGGPVVRSRRVERFAGSESLVQCDVRQMDLVEGGQRSVAAVVKVLV